MVVGANTGTFEGEYSHAQLVAEMATHHHPTLTGGSTAFQVTTGAGANGFGAGAFTFAGQTITGDTGGGAAANVTQPATFYNIYMKL